MLIRFRIRTIPLAFRRGEVLPLPLHRILPSPQPLQKDDNPSLRTAFLPPLFRGEVSVIIIRQNFHQISNQSCTIAKPRPFHYPTKIRNIIKGRNLLRLTAARAEFAAAHSRKGGICYGSQLSENLHSTIVKLRPFHYPTKIRNVIKGRNCQRRLAAYSWSAKL